MDLEDDRIKEEKTLESFSKYSIVEFLRTLF